MREYGGVDEASGIVGILVFPESKHGPAVGFRSCGDAAVSLLVAAIFSSQYRRLVAARVPWMGHPCQKHPGPVSRRRFARMMARRFSGTSFQADRLRTPFRRGSSRLIACLSA